jgi:hypothetical protein
VFWKSGRNAEKAKSGFTGLILGLSAMVATTTQEIFQTALETVPTKKVLAWCQDVLGPSVQAKRRAALSPSCGGTKTGSGLVGNATFFHQSSQ